MEKMTYVKALEIALTTEMSAEVREKLEALKASIEKRSSSKSGKETKAQAEIRLFTESVLEYLRNHDAARCTEIAEALEVTSQKTSAALTKLVRAGLVEKTIEKRVTYFAAVKVAAE